jgi:hypothetical protein
MPRCSSTNWPLALLLVFCSLPGLALSQVVFTVDSPLDQIDADLDDMVCATTAGTCTLRAAVMQANRASGAGAVINVPAGNYPLVRAALPGGAETGGSLRLLAPASGSPSIRIQGAGRDQTIIDANQIDYVLRVESRRRAEVLDLTLRNGYVIGLHNEGSLTLKRVAVVENRGVGILNGTSVDAALTLDDSYVADNVSQLDGGGIFSSGTLTVTGSTIARNFAWIGGGGIWIEPSSSATIEHTRILDNHGRVDGGGIRNLGVLKLSDSSVSGNTSHSGGGVQNERLATIRNTTISHNLADVGGGLMIYANTATTISNSTVAANQAKHNGGGAAVRGNTNIYNSTIEFNRSAVGTPTGIGGGLHITGSTLAIRNTLVGMNVNDTTESADDCFGVVGSYGYNLLGDSANCTLLVQTGNWDILSPGSLGALGSHGGPAATVPLRAGSNAIDAATLDGGCRDDLGPLPRDQRGLERVGACDIGAFEHGAIDPDLIFRDGFES